MEWSIIMGSGRDSISLRGILLLLLVLFAAGVVCYFFGMRKGESRLYEASEVKVDTLIVFDTIMSYEPVYVERVKVERVPVIVEKTDTMMVRDTMYVYMDREQLMWQDSLSRVWVSGVMPHVDSVEHFITERVVTMEVAVPKLKKSRWGLGIQVGYGVNFSRDVSSSPYVGVGISFNLLSW